MSQVEQISQTQHLNGFDDILERMHTHPLYSHDGAQAMPISKITRKNKYAQQKKIVVDSGYPRGNSLQPPVKLMQSPLSPRPKNLPSFASQEGWVQGQSGILSQRSHMNQTVLQLQTIRSPQQIAKKHIAFA